MYIRIIGKPKIQEEVILKIYALRKSGKSIKEIVTQLHLGVGTVSRYCKGILLSDAAKSCLDSKRYPARRVSSEEKVKAALYAVEIVKNIDNRDIFLIFCALYWGGRVQKLS